MVEVHPYNALWEVDFMAESIAIGSAIGASLIALHHIGSTAVVGAVAKPVIDMLAIAPSLGALDTAAPALTALGYQAMGSYGIEGRRYFRKDDPAGRRTHQLHGYATGSREIERHLAVRDYLRAHPAIMRDYSNLKQRLVASNEDYIEGKAPFVLATQADALAWYRAQSRDY